MPLDTDKIRDLLLQHAAKLGSPPRTVVAFSGGRDSTVLLTIMADLVPYLETQLSAVHVNHGLQQGANDWQAHCAQRAAALKVPFSAIDVVVPTQGAAGPEGNARHARYAALAGLLGDGDWLMTGHHLDDQGETVLLNLMRGSGVTGVRGMATCRVFHRGFLLRPLLACSAAEIADFATHRDLPWIDDLSNEDTAFDRNFLRHEVIPTLTRRWPAASRQLARSAQLAATAAKVIEELAGEDTRRCGTAARLAVSALLDLSVGRLANVLRHACRSQGLPAPPRHQLAALINDLLPARPDATPLVSWPGGEARRFRDHLYLLAPLPEAPPAPARRLTPNTRVSLGDNLGDILLGAAPRGGIVPQVAEQGLEIRYRSGGEVLQPAGRGIEKSLKSLLQEAAVVPWMRARVPLLYRAESLVAVADLWVADEYFSADGVPVIWDEKPALS